MRNTGDRLKECRIMKGLSRGEMSEMLHVSTDYLARLETGYIQDYREGGKT